MQSWRTRIIPAHKQGRNGMINTTFALHFKPRDGEPIIANVSGEAVRGVLDQCHDISCRLGFV